MLVPYLMGRDNLENLKQRWKDNIKMYIKEIGCEGMDWIQLAFS